MKSLAKFFEENNCNDSEKAECLEFLYSIRVLKLIREMMFQLTLAGLKPTQETK